MNQWFSTLLIIAILGLAAIFVINTFSIDITIPTTQKKEKNILLIPKEIQGSSITDNQKTYTLNFEQQNTLINWINQSEPFSGNLDSLELTSIEKITLHLFNKPDIDLYPSGLIENQFLFFSPTWKDKGQMIEPSKGKLKQLLTEAAAQ